MPTAERVLFASAVLMLVVISYALTNGGLLERQSLKAFYCAGRAVDERANPYRVEPLRTCERRVSPEPLPAAYVEPAPLPGYALAIFAALAKLPPHAAALLFALLLVAASVLSAQCIAALTRFPRTAVLAAMAPLTLLNVAFGETALLAMLALCVSALALARERWHVAGIAASLALIQPNIALPAAIALFLFAPKTRLALAAACATLAAISLVALGPAVNLEYVSVVLPQQFAAELVASDQYSFARVLYELGLSEQACAILARLVFAIALVGSIAIAHAVARRRMRLDALALVPPAIALLGSLFVHDLQIVIALPGCFVIGSLLRGSKYWVAAAAALALLVPLWSQHVGRAALFLDFAAVAAAVYCIARGGARRRAVTAAGAALAVVFAIFLVQRVERPIRVVATNAAAPAASDASAAVAWGTYLRATPSLTQPRFVTQLPTWFGLIALTVASLRLARGRSRRVWRTARIAPVP